MEHYGLKELTLDLFKKLLNEPDLANSPHLGFVIQAYLRDSYADTEKMLNWARHEGRQFTIRLVKGAYWDFEKVVAAQKTWEIPVYLSKPETDANYERITRLLLENRDSFIRRLLPTTCAVSPKQRFTRGNSAFSPATLNSRCCMVWRHRSGVLSLNLGIGSASTARWENLFRGWLTWFAGCSKILPTKDF